MAFENILNGDNLPVAKRKSLQWNHFKYQEHSPSILDSNIIDSTDESFLEASVNVHKL